MAHSKADDENDDILRAVGAILPGLPPSEREAMAAAERVLEPGLRQFKAQEIFTRNMEDLPRLNMRGGRVLVGGGGIVMECRHADVEGRKYALKVPRASLLGSDFSKIALEQRNARLEALRTAMLSHRNVASLAGLSKVSLFARGSAEWSVTVQLTEWLEDAKPLDEHVYAKCLSIDHLIDLLCQVMRGLEHIHGKRLIHWDVKAANCLVTDGGRTVRVTDIGNARPLWDRPGMEYEADEVAMTSRENAPAAFIKWTTDEPDSKRIHVPLRKGTPPLDRPQLDLYMAGRMMRRLLGIEAERADLQLARAAFQKRLFRSGHSGENMPHAFLSIIAERLNAAMDEESGRLAGAPYYSHGSEVAADLAKLSAEFGAANDIPELYAVSRHVLRLPVTRNTEYSPRIAKLIDSTPIRRLRRHEQLGLTHHVYPGARHVRHEHVVGVIHRTIDYVRALYSDGSVPHFRMLCDSRDVRALIFASAVHDMGHGAFGHYLEECRPLFRGCSHENYAQAVLLNDASRYSAEINPEDFQADRLSLTECASEWLSSASPAKGDVEAFLAQVARILRPEQPWPGLRGPNLKSRDDSALTRTHILHSVIDGALDADKFDYLKRDGHHGGLDYPFGTDDDRFLQALTVAVEPPGDAKEFRPTIAVTTKGVQPVESLLVARYQMFSVMYWHRTARAATVALNHVVAHLLGDSLVREGPAGFHVRRSTLLSELRRCDDAKALDWLHGEVAKTSASLEIKGALDDVLRSLQERDKLPVRIFETHHAEIRANPDDFLRYKRILRLHAALQELSPADYFPRWRRLQDGTWARLRAGLPDAARRGLPERPDGNLFIDVPNESKDQVDHLYVVVPSDVGMRVTPFNAHSVMADAIRDGFRYWAKRTRIFVPRETRRVAFADMPPSRLSALAFDCLAQAYDEAVGDLGRQEELPI